MPETDTGAATDNTVAIQGPSTIDHGDEGSIAIMTPLLDASGDVRTYDPDTGDPDNPEVPIMVRPVYYMDDPESNGTVKRWYLEGSDAGRFNLKNLKIGLDSDGAVTDTEANIVTTVVGGVLSFKATSDAADPNYENPKDDGTDNVYNITVVAADAAANIVEKRVTVKVLNEPEPGSVRLSAWQPQNGTPLRASVSDPDGGVSGAVWQWYRTVEQYVKEGEGGDYTILPPTRDDANTVMTQPANFDSNSCNEADGTGVCWVRINNSDAAVDTYTPQENRTDDNVTELWRALSASVEYSDNTGEVVMAQMDSEYPVQNADPDNAAPAFAATSDTRTVSENQLVGTEVGTPVTAFDADIDDGEFVLTYWLMPGGDSQYFTIDPGDVADDTTTTEMDESQTGGQIRTKTRLNYEAKSSYTVTVIVRDPSYDPTGDYIPGGSDSTTTDTIRVTINVLNREEKPSLSGDWRQVYMENGTGNVGRYTASDPEDPTGNNIVWDVTGTDAKYFSIADGVLDFKASPNYEAPPMADPAGESREARNVYEITVEASDGGTVTTATRDVLVKVTNVDDTGSINLSSTLPIGDEPIRQRATLNDEDGEPREGVIAATSWEWARSTDQRNWEIIEGAISREYAPKSPDIDHYLRVTAMYWDGESFENPAPATRVKMAEGVTSNPVDAGRITNRMPDFGDRNQQAAPTGLNTFRPVELMVSGTGADARLAIADTSPDNGPPWYLKFDADNNLFHEYTEIMSGIRRVGENARPGQPVGNRIMARDRDDDDDDSLTYSLRVFDGTLDMEPYTDTRITGLTQDVLDAHDNDYQLFQIDQATGQITLAPNTRLNYESGNFYIVTVLVTDPFYGRSIAPDAPLPTTGPEVDAFDTIDLIIEVVDVDENPSVPADVTGNRRTRVIESRTEAGTGTPVEGQGDINQYTNMDRDTGETATQDQLTTALVSARIQGPSTIDRDEGTNMDVPNLVVPITTDQGGGISSETGGDDDTATVMGLPIYYMSDQEDGAQVKRWLLEGSDAGRFTIVLREVDLDADGDVADENEDVAQTVKGGVLSFKKSVTYPNFESPMDAGGNNVYNVTVVATDNSVNIAKKAVTVSVKNTQDPGKITLSTLQPEDGTPIEAMLGDGDGGVSGVVWQWYRSSTEDEENTVGDADATNNIEGILDTTSMLVPDVPGDPPVSDNADPPMQVSETAGGGRWVPIGTPEADTAIYTPDAHRTNANQSELGKYLMVRVMYTDDGPAPHNPMYMVTDNVVQNADPNNKAPWYADDTATRSVAENSHGMAVGAPVKARDADNDDENQLTYRLTGSDAGTFSIEDGTGQIKTKNPSRLNYEGRTVYNVTVTARDPSWDPTDRAKDAATSDSIDVTIMVTDVDERPNFVTKAVFVQGDRSPSFPEGGAGTVADYDAGGTLAGGAVWSLSGTDASSFMIDGNGMLTFVTTPDFEVKSTYQVTVVVTSGGETDSLPVTVSVGNMEEMGEITLWMGTTDVTDAAPQVGETITGLVVDPDNPDGTGITVESWKWSRSDSMTGTFAEIAGATMAAYMVTDDDAEMYLKVTAMYADAQGANKSAYYVTAMVGGTATMPPPTGEFDPLSYDTGAGSETAGDGLIGRDEAAVAVLDALVPGRPNPITIDQATQVVVRYLRDRNN